MADESHEGAHASLKTLGNYDYARVKREFTEDHAKVWDLVRRCYEAEGAGLPKIDVYRLTVKVGSRSFVALGVDVSDEGWLKFDARRASHLTAELPNPPALIEKLANETIAIDNLRVEAREHTPPSPADMIRKMRDGKIGRPSTYARHVEHMSEMIDAGYIERNGNGLYRLTQLGRSALAVLRSDAFATVGIRECEELETDLARIESGEATAFEIAVKHVGLVKDLSVSQRSAGAEPTAFYSAAERERSALPPLLDPERTLPANHPLRLVKRRIGVVLKRHDGSHSNESRSAVRAAVAEAAAELWRLRSPAAVLEELSYNLAYRWLCGLTPDDMVWSDGVFRELVNRERRLVDELRSVVFDEAEDSVQRRHVS